MCKRQRGSARKESWKDKSGKKEGESAWTGCHNEKPAAGADVLNWRDPLGGRARWEEEGFQSLGLEDGQKGGSALKLHNIKERGWTALKEHTVMTDGCHAMKMLGGKRLAGLCIKVPTKIVLSSIVLHLTCFHHLAKKTQTTKTHT